MLVRDRTKIIMVVTTRKADPLFSWIYLPVPSVSSFCSRRLWTWTMMASRMLSCSSSIRVPTSIMMVSHIGGSAAHLWDSSYLLFDGYRSFVLRIEYVPERLSFLYTYIHYRDEHPSLVIYFWDEVFRSLSDNQRDLAQSINADRTHVQSRWFCKRMRPFLGIMLLFIDLSIYIYVLRLYMCVLMVLMMVYATRY